MKSGFRFLKAACSADLPLDLLEISVKIDGMFLRAKKRFKDGKEHRYWSIAKNQRLGGGQMTKYMVPHGLAS